ncbi:Na(+)/H(+) antiporter subunit C [Paenibacillus sp. 598K]|uniref:Na(+)/H(+) antiporter subunit C n=1 Tax=Paenibacillus sp. 598K TaxID=1117987 RepID=UPI000FFA7D14|nr:Na(+)/H(+) antiporter subunit C [Paenibacillus sp. 598K]GBF76891.1 Na(+)/H(+) antiporter subunit C [Paenibacillus sp. 598K]
MELLMFVVIGVLMGVGVYLLLSRSLLRVVASLMLLSHGVHLLLLTMGGLREGAPPLQDESGMAATDPLPQALILTAIVISFGLTAFLIVLAYRTYRAHHTEDLEELRGEPNE